MAQNKDFQIAFAQKVREAAKAIRDAHALAKDVDREWKARGGTAAERKAWFELWANDVSTVTPYTLAEFYDGANAVLDIVAFMENAAVTTDDRAAKLVKVRQD